MSMSEKYMAVFAYWDKEIFLNFDHLDFMFIENQLITLDEQVGVINRLFTDFYSHLFFVKNTE